MNKQRELYQINGEDKTNSQLNLTLQRIAERLDKLEGIRGNPVWWEDIRINPGSFDRPGVSDPTQVVYDVGGGGVNSYLYQFAVNNLASFTVQIPHNYKIGEDIYVHLHWTPGPKGTAEKGKYVGWKINYSWAKIGGIFETMQTADLTDMCAGENHKHQMTKDVRITGTDKNISSMLICNVKRTDTGIDDDWVGSTSGNLPLLLEIDFHYPVDTLGSRTIYIK
jgi:hypothetical protein